MKITFCENSQASRFQFFLFMIDISRFSLLRLDDGDGSQHQQHHENVQLKRNSRPITIKQYPAEVNAPQFILCYIDLDSLYDISRNKMNTSYLCLFCLSSACSTRIKSKQFTKLTLIERYRTNSLQRKSSLKHSNKEASRSL